MTLDELLDTLLDRPVAFHRGFAKLTGSINAALMLSQAMYWRKRTKDEDGWFYKSQEEWETETGMSRREQETARKKLLDSGFWEEWRDRINHRLYFRVKMEAFEVMAESAITQCPKAPLPNGGKRHSSNGSENTPETTDENARDERRRFINKTPIKTSPQKPPNGRAAPLPALPNDLAHLEPEWQEWQQHCREINRPLTPTSARKQIAFMEGMTDSEIRESMDEAIRGRWQSFHREKKKEQPKPKEDQPAFCRL